MTSNILQFNAPNSQSSSPFDRIMRLDEKGNECWYATELLTLLEYKSWKAQKQVVEKAALAIKNSGGDRTSHMEEVVQMAQIGDSPAFRKVVTDYKLSRYGCYIVAMNSDPRKSSVASAQTYFAVKTRQAETNSPNSIAFPVAQPPRELPPADVRVANLKDALEFFGIEPDNPRWAQGIRDLTLNILGVTPTNLLPAERWTGVVELAEDMGYKDAHTLSNRSKLGSFVSKFAASPGIERKKEKRLCNGTDRPIWVYKDNPELRNVIKLYFESPKYLKSK